MPPAAAAKPVETSIETPVETSIENGGWRRDSQGRDFAGAKGRSGVIYRQGEETIDEAFARDAKGKPDTPPKRKAIPKGTGRKPPAPTQTDLRELEHALAEGFAAPAMLAAAFGDEWSANHFSQQGPNLARHLCAAAKHNPWLRAKLEAAILGEDFMIQLVTLLGVGGALFAYAIPPVIYWLNLPVPDQAREMFAIPPRRTREEETDTDGPTPAAAAKPRPVPAAAAEAA
jgi:hypothetical protein